MYQKDFSATRFYVLVLILKTKNISHIEYTGRLKEHIQKY